MVKVAACLLAATAVKQARNKRLRNDRRKKSVWVREWLLSRDKYGMYEKLVLVVFDQLFYELSLELPVLIVLLSVVVDRMVQPELCHYMLWRLFVQAYCFSSTFPSSVLLLRMTLNREIQLAVGFPVELARQTAPQMSLTSLFLCRLVAYQLLDKKTRSNGNVTVDCV